MAQQAYMLVVHSVIEDSSLSIAFWLQSVPPQEPVPL